MISTGKHLGRFAVVFSLFFASIAHSEPWLGNRFAQNCSSCHSGGRLNVPTKERRCTSSCQACHVNPNGGGLRNYYGQWNQQRWLKTFQAKGAIRADKPTPLPAKEQDYFRRSAENFMHSESLTEVVDARGDQLREPAVARRARTQTPSPSPPIEDTSGPKGRYAWGVSGSEADYGNASDNGWMTEASNKEAFLSRIPPEDPYYQEREFVTVGLDLKYVYRNFDGEFNGVEVPDDEKTETYISQIDLGFRFRPLREKFAVVIEPRFYNYPDGTDIENAFTNGAAIHSAYAIIDDMVYNSFLMYGLYMPMFGYSHPDENTNFNRIVSQSVSGTKVLGARNFNYFKAIGAGASLQNTYLNLHYIQPTNEESPSAGGDNLDSKEAGVVATLGYRTVKYSLNSWLSFWSTENKDLNRKRNMYSFTTGGKYGRWVGNLDLLNVENIDLTTDFKNSGSTYTADVKYRLWREVYGQLYYSLSNTALDLTAGSATESMLGIKSYLVAGLEFELLFINRQEKKESAPASPTNSNVTQAQLHYYF